MKVTKVVALLLALMMLAVVAAGCGGQKAADNSGDAKTPDADKTINLKVGHVLAPTHPYHLGLTKFSELVSEKTGGKVKVDVFPSSQLGNEREMIEALQMGTLDMTLVSTAPLAGFSNKFLVFDLPFIFQTREQAYKVVDGPIGTDIMQSLQQNGIVGLGYWENGFRNLTNSKRPVVKPEDAKGLKIRTMENKIHMASFKAVGADPTPMAFGELYTALQQKTVDGQENPLAIIYTSKFYEVQKYLSMTGHFYAASPLLVSKAVWDKLPADAQKALQEAAIEARDYERGLIQESDQKLLDEVKKLGMEVAEVDKAEWIKAMEPVYQEYEPQIGKDLIEQIKNTK